MSELHRAIQDRSNAFRPTHSPPFAALRARKRTRDRRRVGATAGLAVVAVLGIGLGPSALVNIGGVPPDQVAADPTPGPSEADTAATPSAAATFEPSAPVPKFACGAEGSGWPEGTEAAGYEAYVGLSLEQATDLAAERDDVLRVLGQDGVCAEGPFTADLRSDRVNLYLDSGKVVSAYPG